MPHCASTVASKRKWAAALLIVLTVAALAATFAWAARIAGTARSEILTGTAGPDLIRGKGGSDQLHGLAGNDVIVGGAGADSIFCGPGRDIAYRDPSDRAVRGCEVIRSGRAPAERPPARVVELRVCPAADVRRAGAGFLCSVNRSGDTLTARRVYCTVRIVNGSFTAAEIAFLRNGSEIFRTRKVQIKRDRSVTVFGSVAPESGHYGCLVKLDGQTRGAVAFAAG